MAMMASEACPASASSATLLPPISPQRTVQFQQTPIPGADATMLASRCTDGPKRFRTLLVRRIGNTVEGPTSQLYSMPSPSLPSMMSELPSILRQAPAVSNETTQIWRSYRNLATTGGHRGDLQRGPRWRSETRIVELARTEKEADANLLSWAADSQSAHVLRRRDLRRKLREAKDGLCDMSSKRGFVGGHRGETVLVASEDFADHTANEQSKIAKSMDRIAGAIRDCSRSRKELVTMQRTMAAVTVEEEEPKRISPLGLSLGLQKESAARKETKRASIVLKEAGFYG